MSDTARVHGAGGLTQVAGLKSLELFLKMLPQNIQRRVIRKALRKAAVPIVKQTRKEARKVAKSPFTPGYKRKKGKHLYASVGTRLKTYTKGGVVFLAAGFMHREGGYHGHLVEEGHRIVTGGTIASKSGGKAGITAGGKRWLESHGLTKGRMPIAAIHGWGKGAMRKGRMRTDTGAIAWQFKGDRARGGLNPGKWYKFGGSAFGKQIRGGGSVRGKTRPRPMLKPSWEKHKSECINIIIREGRKQVGKEAIKLAKKYGMKKLGIK